MTEAIIEYLHIPDVYNHLIPEEIGAYVITHTWDNVYAQKYIGSSNNLHRRIGEHWNKNIIFVDLYITDDLDLARSLERILTELIIPITNISVQSLYKEDKEIMNALLKSSNILQYTSNNIVKIGCRYLKCIIGYKREQRMCENKIKTINVNGDIHKLIKDKIKEIKNQYGLDVTIESIVDSILRNGIPSYSITKINIKDYKNGYLRNI